MGSPLAKPARIGKYDIVGVIGRGGMGVVYRAMDPRIGRPVAVKVLTSAFGEDQELLARFYREARYTGGLQHQNIVTVYEFGEQDGFPFLVMEYLEGESLDDIIASRRQLPLAERLGIMVQVCNGLSFAHQRGVVHRDVKPANIVVLRNGTAKIVDFGIAHVGGNRLTRTGQVMGSIYYMSPEQLNGNVEVDLRTDVYSTGVVLFQLLTGALPFQGNDTGSTLMKIVHEPPPLLSKFMKLYPPELETISQKALAKDREQRYPSAEDLAFDLARLQQGLTHELVEGYLQKAADAIERKEFTIAREQLLQVLRVDSQNSAANMLLREIQQGLEQQRRQQQLKQARAQAEEALSYKHYDSALEHVQRGLELEATNAELQDLRAAIQRAQEENARYEDALRRAELALKRGSLDEARKAIGEALEVDAENPRGRTLAASIAKEIEESARQQKAAQMQVIRATNSVEKALADARMHLFLDQRQEAQEALRKVSREISQVSRDLRSQWEALREEVERKLGARQHVPPESGRGPGEDSTASVNVTPASQARTPMPQATLLFGNQPAADETIQPEMRGADFHSTERNGEIPEDLREFLPSRSTWVRPGIWIAAAVLVLIIVSYMVFWPKPTTRGNLPEHNNNPKPVDSATTAEPSYAVINAEPWGTVTEVDTLKGDRVKTVNDQTPLRLELPAGQYRVKVEGPKGEKRVVDIEVPSQGGQSYLLVFHKPDVGGLITRQ